MIKKIIYTLAGILLFIAVAAASAEAATVKDDKSYAVHICQDQGNLYLKGQKFSNATDLGINSNFIKAATLKNILDDDKDNDLADYRKSHNGGDRIDNDPLVIDLRNKEDYNMRHIPGAIWIATSEDIAEARNIQILNDLLKKHVADGGKNELVLYCYTGHSSGLVAGVLGTLGLPVKNLMYGFDIAWRGTRTSPQPIYAPMEDNSGNKHLCGG